MTQAFERVSAISPLPAHLRGGVVAIGNFDGVHRGHQAVLERALAEARRRGAPALVLTFEPHPRKVFRPEI
ncbi:MAG: bifunctional riboflavin kinase/FAD synthetase, partial [Mesorhizobium sp.]